MTELTDSADDEPGKTEKIHRRLDGGPSRAKVHAIGRAYELPCMSPIQ